MEIKLHDKQWEVFEDPSRIKVVVSGRRWGKTRLQSASIFYKCLSYNRDISRYSPETIVVTLPTLVMAKRVIWDPLVNLFKDLPGCTINRTTHRISIPNKPTIIVAGAENLDALRGLRIYYAALDEFQDNPPTFFASVIRPAMADTDNSSCLITGTPKGINNHFYDLATSPNVRFFTFPTSSNPYILRSEIEYARATLSERLFKQEFEATWVDFGGSIYPELSTRHIYISPPNLQRVFMGVDWGDVNPAYVVVGISDIDEDNLSPTYYVLEARQLGDGVNAVPFSSLLSEVSKACKRWDVYRVFCDPSRPSSILDFRSEGLRANIKGLERAIRGDNKIDPGNNHVNNLLHMNKLFLPKSAKKLFQDMSSYSRKKIRGTDRYSDKVEDGQNDHMIDALRYCLFTLYQNSRKSGLHI